MSDPETPEVSHMPADFDTLNVAEEVPVDGGVDVLDEVDKLFNAGLVLLSDASISVPEAKKILFEMSSFGTLPYLGRSPLAYLLEMTHATLGARRVRQIAELTFKFTKVKLNLRTQGSSAQLQQEKFVAVFMVHFFGKDAFPYLGSLSLFRSYRPRRIIVAPNVPSVVDVCFDRWRKRGLLDNIVDPSLLTGVDKMSICRWRVYGRLMGFLR